MEPLEKKVVVAEDKKQISDEDVKKHEDKKAVILAADRKIVRNRAIKLFASDDGKVSSFDEALDVAASELFGRGKIPTRFLTKAMRAVPKLAKRTRVKQETKTMDQKIQEYRKRLEETEKKSKERAEKKAVKLTQVSLARAVSKKIEEIPEEKVAPAHAEAKRERKIMR
jgi:hypothetical protein